MIFMIFFGILPKLEKMLIPGCATGLAKPIFFGIPDFIRLVIKIDDP